MGTLFAPVQGTVFIAPGGLNDIPIDSNYKEVSDKK